MTAIAADHEAIDLARARMDAIPSHCDYCSADVMVIAAGHAACANAAHVELARVAAESASASAQRVRDALEGLPTEVTDGLRRAGRAAL